MSERSKDITVTNTLIATTLDSVKGYRDASEDSEAGNSAFFASMAEERSRVASDLQAYVRSLGGDAEDDSTLAGALHRGFMNLKDAVASRDEKAIINEVERGEDYLKGKYETALDDVDLQPGTRTALQKAYQSVKAGHDKISAMKHAAG